MKKNVRELKLFRCILAVVLAAGLTLPSMGTLAWGEGDESASDFLKVNDKPLGGEETAPAEGDELPSEGEADPSPAPDEPKPSDTDDVPDADDAPAASEDAETPMGGGAPSADVAPTVLPAASNAALVADSQSDVLAATASEDGVSAQTGSFTDYGGLSISGGMPGTDYALETITYARIGRGTDEKGTQDGRSIARSGTPSEALSMLVIKRDGTYVIKNTVSSAQAVPTGIRVAPGVKADITFAGVNISSHFPMDIATNSTQNTYDTVEINHADVKNPTTVHLTLADGTANVLRAGSFSSVVTGDPSFNTEYPGLRCGEGSVLTIDDGVRNVDVAGNPIAPVNGLIPAGTQYVNRDGEQIASTGDGKDLASSLSNLESRQAGTLHVMGGIRSAAIGGGPLENSGFMTFNGGIITAEANDPGTNGAGCGIGGGHAGGGTTTIINGGTIVALGSYHGAGIGGGCTYNGGMSRDNKRTYPLRDALLSRHASSTIAGDITINGGFVRSKGWTHSNAFGQGCGGTNTGKTILVTGGTLLPEADLTQQSGFLDIGGEGGYVIITGGSVYCGTNSTGFKFQGNDGDGKAWGDLAMTTKVGMITVDVKSKIQAMADKEQVTPDFDAKLESWELLIDKFLTDPLYGAPARLNEGKLYLWLPDGTNKNHQIDANFSYYVGDKLLTSKTTLPEGNTGTTVKEWEEFILDETFVEENWSKYYDGEGLKGIDVEEKPIPVENPADGSLDDNNYIKYNFQQMDEDGNALGAASTSTETPADAGLYDIEVRSDQYASNATFAQTYWGHVATGRAVISPVTSKTSWELSEPVKLKVTKEDGTVEEKEYSAPTWAQDENAGNFNTATNNHLVVPVDVTSDKLPFGDAYPDGSNMSKPTCKAPTGRLQLYVDDRMVPESLGGVIEFDRADLEDTAFEEAWIKVDATGREHTMAYFNLTRGQLEAFGLEDKSADGNQHSVYVEYTSARKGSGPRDESTAGVVEAAALAPLTDVETDESWQPAHNDSAYVNYYESANESVPVEIELATPDFRLFNETGTGYVPNGEGLSEDQQVANDAKLKLDDKTERDWIDPGTLELRGTQDQTDVSEFRDVVDEGTGTVTETRQDWFPLYVQTNSIGDIVFTSSNPSVIQIEPNDFTSQRTYVDGKTDYGVGAKAKVISAGKATITATIKGTGAYSSVTKSFDVYVFPDLAKEPELTMAENAYNATRSDGTIRPGDTLRYVVTATNTKNDTACINPVYELGIPADTDFESLVALDPEGNEVPDVKYGVCDGKVVVESLPTLFGGQSYKFRMDVKVKPDVVTKPDGQKADLLSKSKTEGIYGVNPDKFAWDDRIPAEGLPASPAEVQANPTLPDPDPAPEPEEPEPIVPDGPAATEILGGDLLDPQPEDPDDPDSPKKPGVPVGPVESDSPFGEAVKADPDDPSKPAAPDDPTADPDTPEGQPPREPVKEGDVIVKFGDKEDPESPDDIAKELDEQIQKKIEEDPEADHVDIPVTIERPNPDDPDADPEIVNVIVTVPITPEMRPEPPAPVDPDDRDDHDLVIVPADVDPRSSGDITTTKTAENVTPGFDKRPNKASALVGDTVRFTITVGNSKPGSAYYDVIVKDPLLVGISYVPGSAVVTDATGMVYRDFEADWDAGSRTLGFCVGDVPGLTQATVTFDCVVTGEALSGNGDLSNVAVPLGTQPSQTVPEPDPDNPTSGPVVIKRDPTPPGPYNPEDHGTTWDDKEKEVIDEIRDIFPDIPEGEDIAIPESEPADPGKASPSDPKLVDDDEGPADVKLVKSAENLDRSDGSTHVGDTVRYTVTVSNAKQYSMWYDAVIRDVVPAGLEVLDGTMVLTDAKGESHQVSASCYDTKTRVLAVACGDLAGGSAVTLVFDALVTEDAVGADVGNVATAHGTLPSTREPGGTGSVPGAPFVPSEGWSSFIAEHPGVSNPDPVYPSANVNAKGGVVGNAGDADDKKDRTLLRLAQTGDAATTASVIALVCALASAVLTILALFRRGRRRSA